jgi:hypothetical protein
MAVEVVFGFGRECRMVVEGTMLLRECRTGVEVVFGFLWFSGRTEGHPARLEVAHVGCLVSVNAYVACVGFLTVLLELWWCVLSEVRRCVLCCVLLSLVSA